MPDDTYRKKKAEQHGQLSDRRATPREGPGRERDSPKSRSRVSRFIEQRRLRQYETSNLGEPLARARSVEEEKSETKTKTKPINKKPQGQFGGRGGDTRRAENRLLQPTENEADQKS